MPLYEPCMVAFYRGAPAPGAPVVPTYATGVGWVLVRLGSSMLKLGVLGNCLKFITFDTYLLRVRDHIATQMKIMHSLFVEYDFQVWGWKQVRGGGGGGGESPACIDALER